MNPTKEHPIVFISYAWGSKEHENWVINLAQKLTHDGIVVKLDKWSLNIGDDKNAFMESMVTDESIDYVIIVSNSTYAQKADKRQGGTGTESQIISQELYGKVKETRVIPLLRERDDSGKECLPVFLRSRIYIDFSSEELFESSYQTLIRQIYHLPEIKEPVLGTKPSYLTETAHNHSELNTAVLTFESKIERNPAKMDSILEKMLQMIDTELECCKVNAENRTYEEIGRALVQSINDYLPTRDAYIAMLEKIFEANYKFDIDILIGFFEKRPTFFHPPLNGSTSYYDFQFEGHRYYSRELLLYTIAAALKYKRYEIVSDLLYSRFNYKDTYYLGYRDSEYDYSALGYNITSFDDYLKKRDGLNYISCMATLMIQNANKSIGQETLVDADIICGYVSQLKGTYWRPFLCIYKSERKEMELIERLYSKRHFEKVKCLFNVNTADELKSKIEQLNAGNTNNNVWIEHVIVPSIVRDIDLKQLCSSR